MRADHHWNRLRNHPPAQGRRSHPPPDHGRYPECGGRACGRPGGLLEGASG